MNVEVTNDPKAWMPADVARQANGLSVGLTQVIVLVMYGDPDLAAYFASQPGNHEMEQEASEILRPHLEKAALPFPGLEEVNRLRDVHRNRPGDVAEWCEVVDAIQEWAAREIPKIDVAVATLQAALAAGRVAAYAGGQPIEAGHWISFDLESTPHKLTLRFAKRELLDLVWARWTDTVGELEMSSACSPDPQSLPLDIWVPAQKAFGWLAFGDPDAARDLSTVQRAYKEKQPAALIAKEFAWLGSYPPDVRARIDALERKRDLFVEMTRAGTISAYLEAADGEMRCVPSQYFSQGLTINILDGRITFSDAVPDNDLDAMIGSISKLKAAGPLGHAWFKRSELAAAMTSEAQVDALPPSDSIKPPSDALPQAVSSHPKPTNPAVRKWFRDRVAGWPPDQKAPSEKADWDAACRHFAPGLNRDDDFRPARKEETPPGWQKQGPRKSWGIERGSQ